MTIAVQEKSPGLTLPRAELAFNGQLLEMFDAYEWFSPEDYASALMCCRAAAVARAQGATNQVTFFLSSIQKLYHHDRASRGSSVLPDDPEPTETIPSSVAVDDEDYHAVVTTLNLQRDVPLSAIPRVAAVAMHSLPDELVYVTYEKEREINDPLIYAKYGHWFVKIAQWD
jgi:hypothetical protein